MKKSPWTDLNGREIYEGDTIRHPSGEEGTVVFIASESCENDQWRVDYGKQSPLSRLCLQIGQKGQAVAIRPDAI